MAYSNGLQLHSMDLCAEFAVGMELPAMLVLLQYILGSLGIGRPPT